MEKTGKVIAVCVSEKKGTQKTEVPSIRLIPEWGIENDAHAGKWHRQVSLLALEKIKAFRAKGADVDVLTRLSTNKLTDASLKAELISMMFVRTYPGPEIRFRVYEGTVEGSEKTDINIDPSILAGEDYTWYVSCRRGLHLVRDI